MTLEILNFGVHCLARTIQNLLKIRYPDNCSVYVAKKHGRRDLQKTFPCSLIPGYDQSNAPKEMLSN